MKPYSDKISLVRNGRGVYCIDTIMGCTSGMAARHGGCYGDCYAAKTAERYGHDFSKSILRRFISEKHKRDILLEISKIKMPFIRIGCSGDPSENWGHTFEILRTLSKCNTEIVIITRHWNLLTDEQLKQLSKMNICINTSVSALDNSADRIKSISQFERIKPYCKSVLRIVSCNFNLSHSVGQSMASIQEQLFSFTPNIDTVFRPSMRNPFVEMDVIKVKEEIFNGKKQLASKYNRKTYMGKCSTCKEMCGITLDARANNRPLVKQTKLL